jgi:nitroreductase
MDFDEAGRKRKMIREYQQDSQIPTEIINKLLKNAHRSPSAGHTQVQECNSTIAISESSFFILMISQRI